MVPKRGVSGKVTRMCPRILSSGQIAFHTPEMYLGLRLRGAHGVTKRRRRTALNCGTKKRGGSRRRRRSGFGKCPGVRNVGGRRSSPAGQVIAGLDCPVGRRRLGGIAESRTSASGCLSRAFNRRRRFDLRSASSVPGWSRTSDVSRFRLFFKNCK